MPLSTLPYEWQNTSKKGTRQLDLTCISGSDKMNASKYNIKFQQNTD